MYTNVYVLPIPDRNQRLINLMTHDERHACVRAFHVHLAPEFPNGPMNKDFERKATMLKAWADQRSRTMHGFDDERFTQKHADALTMLVLAGGKKGQWLDDLFDGHRTALSELSRFVHGQKRKMVSSLGSCGCALNLRNNGCKRTGQGKNCTCGELYCNIICDSWKNGMLYCENLSEQVPKILGYTPQGWISESNAAPAASGSAAQASSGSAAQASSGSAAQVSSASETANSTCNLVVEGGVTPEEFFPQDIAAQEFLDQSMLDVNATQTDDSLLDGSAKQTDNRSLR